MAIFEKKKRILKKARSKSAEREELFRRVKEIAEGHSVEWVNKTFSPGGDIQELNADTVRTYVEEKLEEAFEEMVYEAVGIERRYDRTSVKYSSPMREEIERIAKQEAHAILEKLLKSQEKKLPSSLPLKVRRAVERAYEEAYVSRLHYVARELAERKAEQDVEAIFASLSKTPRVREKTT